jgi:hypothetical protein
MERSNELRSSAHGCTEHLGLTKNREKGEVFLMRTLILTVTLFAFSSQSRVAFAQQGTQDAQVEATPIEKVLDAKPEPDGKAYRIDLLVSKGTRVAYKIPPSETAKRATAARARSSWWTTTSP